MRKQYKEKKRSCGLCKPHKKGYTKRWKKRDEARMKEVEAELRRFRRFGVPASEEDDA